ncbi:MAG: hypothetical protein KY464_07135 [Gemmatimonadetes bacterium]|nr:hypothetical protein [Gemmatimonadota bacterium]
MAKSPGEEAAQNPEEAEAEAATAPATSALAGSSGRAEQRRRSAEPSRTERVYAVAFGRVWLAALAAAAAMSRWTVTSTNSVRGEISIETRGLLSKTTQAARVLIALDDVGLTRVDAVFLGPSGEPAEGAEARQIDRFHQHLEALLRRDF